MRVGGGAGVLRSRREAFGLAAWAARARQEREILLVCYGR